MQQVVNRAQAEAWNGYEGQHWADHQSRYDAVNSGFNGHLLDAAAIGARSRVLDVGCGNGQLTRLAAGLAPAGRVTGIDLSAPMLERARATAVAEGLDNVSYTQADAQVHPFPAGAYDVVLSRFGIMFFADPVAAFGNLRRALRPDGQLVFVSLRDAGDLGVVLDAMTRLLPPPARTGMEDPTGPMSLADPAVIRTLLGAAGFVDVSTVPVEAPQVWGRDSVDAAGFLGGWGPIRHLLDQVDPETAARARAELPVALRAYQDVDAVRLRGTAWLVTARCAEPAEALPE